ncbi:peroxidase family protein [Nitratireductor sp. XY-223]|uniref:peroxidase family protein n=1 Tax=Nitratireductor sp. XY-223 TaxID=2561926 RepID=UPI00145ADB8C|nr:peroxidase family protein [Nitratireductor sp. XY-223]
MVFSTLPFRSTGTFPRPSRNIRGDRLILDTIYGGGPDATPICYALSKYTTETPEKLRLGRIVPPEKQKKNDGQKDIEAVKENDTKAAEDAGTKTAEESDTTTKKEKDLPPLRDIARVDCISTNDDRLKQGSAQLRTALVADARNDDNLFLSQFLALMHQFHNSVCAAIDDVNASGDAPGGKPLKNGYDKYIVARRLVTAAYRNIMVNDYLRKILNPEVRRHYLSVLSGRGRFLDDPGDARMPLEFSHAAFRFGHSMVRGEYSINNVGNIGGPAIGSLFLKQALNASSGGKSPSKLPLLKGWLIAWSHFFAFDKDQLSKLNIEDVSAIANPQPSRKIIPSFVPDFEAIFPEGKNSSHDLAFRDLVRSIEAGSRSVGSLVEIIKQNMPESVWKNAPAMWASGSTSHGLKHEIAQWLQQGKTEFTADEIERISADPPLLFFILFEAQQGGGNRLGLIGSVIVAEVLFQSLASTSDLIEGDEPARAWAGKIFHDFEMKEVWEIVAFIHKRYEYRNGEPKFI